MGTNCKNCTCYNTEDEKAKQTSQMLPMVQPKRQIQQYKELNVDEFAKFSYGESSYKYHSNSKKSSPSSKYKRTPIKRPWTEHEMPPDSTPVDDGLSKNRQEHIKSQINKKEPEKVSTEKSDVLSSAQSIRKFEEEIKFRKQTTLHMNDFKAFKFMKDISSRYQFGKTLGKGAYGIVKTCKHIDSGNQFAVKIITKEKIQEHKINYDLLCNELTLLSKSSHPNIIRIIDLIEDKQSYYVVSDFVKGGELFKRLIKTKNFTEDDVGDIVYQIMLGLNYLHQQSITHRDLKPQNILLASRNKDCFDIKIADLGFAKKFDKKEGMDTCLGTPLYMAPELVKEQKYSEKVDVWSLGVIVYQLLSGVTPFDGKNLKMVNQNICNKQVTFGGSEWKLVSQKAKDFIMRCLKHNQNKRPSIEQLLDDPWICEVPENSSNGPSEKQKLCIQNNLIQYNQCSSFQKLVLSLISGLNSSEEELDLLQKEFLRLDKDKSGTLSLEEITEMTNCKWCKKYDIDWVQVLEEVDYNGDGVIDFQEFISATVDRQVLRNDDDIQKAFKILDTNKDGTISLDDFDGLFFSYEGAKMDMKIWTQLLKEADVNGDGVVSYEEFRDAMQNILINNLTKKKIKTTEK